MRYYTRLAALLAVVPVIGLHVPWVFAPDESSSVGDRDCHQRLLHKRAYNTQRALNPPPPESKERSQG